MLKRIKIQHSLQRYSLLITFLILSFMSLNSQANDNLKWQNSNYIMQAFAEIALKNEYRKTKGRVLKWHAPIHYQFKYHSIEKNTLVESLFNVHLKHLNSITSHPIKESTSKTNLTIHLTQDKHFANVIKNNTYSSVKNLERDSHCMASFQTNKKGEITQAQIVLPLDHVFSRGLLVACIVEESTQIMGLPNDSDWVHPTIANDASKVELLTGLDYILLKILYHPSLQAGYKMHRSRVTIENIIQNLQSTSEIEQASDKVNSSGLFPLIN